ncbi:MAG: GNAT family N-acetyltransferase, partial [Caulobacteraceae bacterium]
LGLPYIVAEAPEGHIDGFAYASPFRMRAAYRYTAEDTVYVRPGEAGLGVGRALVSQVIEACEAQGLRQLVAVIGDSANAASIGLHRALGFRTVGVCEGFGYKFGRWVDVVLMQRALNGGSEGEPPEPGLAL